MGAEGSKQVIIGERKDNKQRMQSQEGQKKNYIYFDEQAGATVRGYVCQSQSSLGRGHLGVHWRELDLPEMWGQLGKRKLEEGLENQRWKCSSSSRAGPVGTSRGSQEQEVPLEAHDGGGRSLRLLSHAATTLFVIRAAFRRTS